MGSKIWKISSYFVLHYQIIIRHGHSNTILGLQWNQNGNWLLSGARDQLIKMFDIRMMKEVQTFRGHKREVFSVSWHPIHETLFASGGYEGSMHFWFVG